MRKVLHFVRKSTQLRAPFIANQILSHRRYSPEVIFGYKVIKDFDGGFGDFDYSGINIINLDMLSSHIDRFFWRIKKVSPTKSEKLKKLLINIQPDILHFHYGTDAGLFLPVLRDLKIPKVVSFYGYDCSSFPKRHFGFGKLYLKKRVFQHATRIFAMSPDMKQDLIRIGCPQEKIIVHYHGIKTDWFNYPRVFQRKQIVYFLMISGFVDKKGHEFLLRSFIQAYKKNSFIRLTIVGAGPLRQKIQEIINTNSMNKYVELKDAVTYRSDEHLNLLKSHDVFIHPSVTDKSGDKEGIPGAMVEAMAAGLPVVSTYHAGIPYIIENNKTGLLVNEWDTEGLCNAIILLSSESNLRETIARAGQSFALDHLALDKEEDELEYLYEELISAKKY